MPLGNLTGMTDEERDALGRWLDGGTAGLSGGRDEKKIERADASATTFPPNPRPEVVMNCQHAIVTRPPSGRTRTR